MQAQSPRGSGYNRFMVHSVDIVVAKHTSGTPRKCECFFLIENHTKYEFAVLISVGEGTTVAAYSNCSFELGALPSVCSELRYSMMGTRMYWYTVHTARMALGKPIALRGETAAAST